MTEFINWLKWACEQAYIYIPTIMAIISAIGIPSLVSIAKIVSNAKQSIKENTTIKQTLKDLYKQVNDLKDSILEDCNNEIVILQHELESTLNVKQKQVIEEKINNLMEKIKRLTSAKIEEVKEIAESKKIKVRVIEKE